MKPPQKFKNFLGLINPNPNFSKEGHVNLLSLQSDSFLDVDLNKTIVHANKQLGLAA